MCASGKTASSKRRIEGEQRHRWRDQRRDMLAAVDPGVDDVSPLLHHMPALMLVLRLVVDAARRPAVLMRQALLDPITVEAEFVQQRRAGSPEVMDRESL